MLSKHVASVFRTVSANTLAPTTRLAAPVRFYNQSSEAPSGKVSAYYGSNLFDSRAMEKYLSKSVLDDFNNSLQNLKPVSAGTADTIARALLQWAQARGATHYTHWFQPLTGAPAEKHDTLFDPDFNGNPIERFRGKDLIMAEPDGSSFPSGGLRNTHTARGYTIWDSSSPPFIIRNDKGATLYIPSVFFAWSDDLVLDDKTPLLRSIEAVKKESVRFFELAQDDRHTRFVVDSGIEQEFFIVDRKYYDSRPDLKLTGRTLLGRSPPKGQELDDHYFGATPAKVLDMIHEFEREMWLLGIPIMTRHNEVAPAQYEVAPKFAPVNQATDRNLIMMQAIRNIAKKHGMAALLHEKPFAGVNGSGKHNNWSFGSNVKPSFLDPGADPVNDHQFMFFLAASLRGLDLHGDLVRAAIASTGNDHRLGANEAPPAIVSAFLGDDLEDAVQCYIKGMPSPPPSDTRINLGVSSLPVAQRQPTDRNRTSTFAFTGNKFELRACGSSQSPARTNIVLNTILAESLRTMTQEVKDRMDGGESFEDALHEVARLNLEKHQRIVFNGDGYSAEWPVEAKKRGLPNLKSTAPSLAVLDSDRAMKLFEDMKVLNKIELLARKYVFQEEHIKKVKIEARTLVDMTGQKVLPVAHNFCTKLAGTVLASQQALGDAYNRENDSQLKTLQRVQVLTNQLYEGRATLEARIDELEEVEEDLTKGTYFAEQELLPVMLEMRAASDALEALVPNWPFPTYSEMLFGNE